MLSWNAGVSCGLNYWAGSWHEYLRSQLNRLCLLVYITHSPALTLPRKYTHMDVYTHTRLHTHHTRIGRHDVDAANFRCLSCELILDGDDPESYVTSQWFPDIGPGGHVVAVVSRELLSLHTSLRLNVPRLSNHGFVNALRTLSKDSDRSQFIAQAGFNGVTRESRYRAAFTLGGLENACCALPAKGSMTCRWAQTDGCMKLELFNSARKDTGLSHYYERNDTANQLFLPASTVERDMATLYTKGESVGDANNCGDRIFAALKSPKAKSAVLVTGAVLGFCPHAMAFGCTPLFRGEQLGMHAIILRYCMERFGSLGGVINGVACQFIVFIRKRCERIGAPADIRVALNVLHAKAHPWFCKFKLGMRSQPGGGWLTGEEDERYFAPLGAASVRLKSSSLPLYKQDITELCQFLNTKKREDLPCRLSQQHKEAELNQQPAWVDFNQSVHNAEASGYLTGNDAEALLAVDGRLLVWFIGSGFVATVSLMRGGEAAEEQSSQVGLCSLSIVYGLVLRSTALCLWQC